jgi:diguanylate cyclase (GGDEF)-like protein
MEVWRELADIWQRHKAQTLGRVTVLEDVILALLEGTLSAEHRQQARSEAHVLAGSVGTLGFVEASRLAGEIERIFLGSDPIGQAQVLRLSELVVSLREALEQPMPGPQPPEPHPTQELPVLLIVDGDPEPANGLELVAAAQGMHVIQVSDVLTASTTCEDVTPCMVLLNLACADTVEDALTLLEAWTHSIPPVPVLVLSPHDVLAHRLAVARLGGCGFLLKPVSPQHILEVVQRVQQPLPDDACKVLAISDAPQVQATLQSLLEPSEAQLTICSDPQTFWDALVATAPELLIFDHDMTTCDTVTLCRAVRQDGRWHEVSVLMLSAEIEAATVQRFGEVGVDTYLRTPLAASTLLAHLSYSVARTRWIRQIAAQDARLGVATQAHARQMLSTLLHLARRQHQHLSLAVVALDRLQQFNAQESSAAREVVLRRLGTLFVQAFRSEDVVARWQGDEFVVGLYSMPRDIGVHRVADVLETIRQTTFTSPSGTSFTATFSAGVAAYPVDGAELGALYAAAAEMLERAQEVGGNCVLPVGWRPDHQAISQTYDVVLVEDDAPLVDLLRHALETRGHRVFCIQDGQEAVDALGGLRPSVRAQLVLLDVSLPSLDGLTVLRRLAQDGVLRQTRVIVLTFRSSEAEVLEALELGAFDHVAKPFSLPVLMQRIRRALIA